MIKKKIKRVDILPYLCVTLVCKSSCYEQTGEEPGIKGAGVIQGVTLSLWQGQQGDKKVVAGEEED